MAAQTISSLALSEFIFEDNKTININYDIIHRYMCEIIMKYGDTDKRRTRFSSSRWLWNTVFCFTCKGYDV